MGQISGEGDAAGRAVGGGSVRGAVSGNLALGWAWSQAGGAGVQGNGALRRHACC